MAEEINSEEKEKKEIKENKEEPIKKPSFLSKLFGGIANILTLGIYGLIKRKIYEKDAVESEILKKLDEENIKKESYQKEREAEEKAKEERAKTETPKPETPKPETPKPETKSEKKESSGLSAEKEM